MLLKSAKVAKSSLYPGMSDGIMTRALHRRKISGSHKFHSHVTDIKLGLSDVPSNLQQVKSLSHLGFPPWDTDKSLGNFSRDLMVGPSDGVMMSSSSSRRDLSSHINGFGISSLGPLGLNIFSSLDLPGKKHEMGVDQFKKTPIFMETPFNVLPNLHNMGHGDYTGSKLHFDFNNFQNTSNLKGKEVLEECNSSKSNLPYWFREVVKAL